MGTRFSFSGSRCPKPLSAGISTVCGLFISMVVKSSSSAFRTQLSPMTTSFGS